MATLTIRIPDRLRDRLKGLAENEHISLNKLFEQFSLQAIAQFDAETEFKLRAARGSPARGLALLDKLDAHYER